MRSEASAPIGPNPIQSMADIPAELPAISVIGLGHVGAVLVACYAQLGHRVAGVDLDRAKVAEIAAGRSPVVETELDDALAQGVAGKRISASTNILDALLETDITFVCVGTPSRADGTVQLSALQDVARSIGAALALKADYHLVVVRSTVPTGTTRGMILPEIERGSGKRCGVDFGLCFHPEFLREGIAIADFHAPAKTVIGQFDEESGAMLAQLYRGIQATLLRTTIEAAEMVKYVDNTWHAVKVAFANEVGRICQSMDLDSHDVMDIFVQDRKLNLSPYYLKPGFAFGGSCLPKDVRAIIGLAHRNSVKVPLIDSLLRSNDSHIDHAFRLISKCGAKRVGLLGLTFKHGTSDLRESPQVDLIGRLLDAGYDVWAHDRNVYTSAFCQAGDYFRTASRTTRVALQALPNLLIDTANQLVEACDVIVVSHATHDFVAALKARASSSTVIDLVRLPIHLQATPGYRGICW
jgi:GDP-mannose 6-dehydrogenase